MKKTSDATHPANRIEVTAWLSAKEAAKKLSVSTDTIERRAIPLDRQLNSWIEERKHFATPAKALRIVRQQLQQRLAEKGLKLD